MSNQFLRIGNLTVFDKRGLTKNYTGLRVKFVIEKTSESTGNTAKINIFNLNSDSRTFIEGDDMRVKLEAGYPGSTEILITGDITKAVSIQKHPDWVTSIECTDGGKALKEKHLDVSFAPGTPFQAIIDQAISTLGVTLGPRVFSVSHIATGGFSFSGTAKDLMDKLTTRFNVEWSIQNGAVQVVSKGTPIPGIATFVSSDNGLVGNVIKREKGIEFSNLINGELVPGKLVNLVTNELSGFYKVRKATFDGDTHDGNWFVNVEAETL